MQNEGLMLHVTRLCWEVRQPMAARLRHSAAPGQIHELHEGRETGMVMK